MHRKNGFTLTEILIVVAILGILASLVMPRLFPQTERARAAEAISILSAIRQGEEAFRLERGIYLALTTATTAASNADWQRIGMENPNIDANRFFDYSVAITAAPSFTATADRRNFGAGGPEYSGSTTDEITLTNAGVWGGDHPFSPD